MGLCYLHNHAVVIELVHRDHNLEGLSSNDPSIDSDECASYCRAAPIKLIYSRREVPRTLFEGDLAAGLAL